MEARMTGQLSVPFRQDIKNLFSDATLASDGSLLVPHTPASTIMLRNMGIDAPSSVRHCYNWPHPADKPPFEVQKITVEMLTENQRAYVLSGMGVGKTACPIFAFDYLRGLGYVKKMLVTCPLSTMNFVWKREVFDFTPHLRTQVLYGTKAQRLDRLKQDADIYIINHDGVGVILEELYKRPDIDVLCLDELAVYRNPSQRAKQMQKFAATRKWVWGMTGAPAPNQPTDVWGQARIVTPNSVPKFFSRFRDQLMYKVSAFKYLPKPDAIEQAYVALQPSVRFALEDVTELPPFISRRIDVAMGPKQQQVYNAVKDHAFALIGTETVTAANAGAVANKLFQISLGYVYAQGRGIVQLDNQARIDAMLDVIEASVGKVIVFSAFKHSLDGITSAIQGVGWDVAQVSGDTPQGKRDQLFHAFQNTPQYRVLNAHPQCLAHGLTLTAADTVIWFGPITSLEIYDQANARIRRVGQKMKQQFIHLQGTPAEKKMYSLLVNKQNVQTQLLDLFRD